ncbi:unnamed protein product [Moneuplotes crassus]|uniref:Uncharacterized protein n=1 Tax=Euplotes crassus TaxID=5936 RepID=A0AAD1UNQ0_EUPCR|nr:unnamed protein product [Moneuplotes crassus]
MSSSRIFKGKTKIHKLLHGTLSVGNTVVVAFKTNLTAMAIFVWKFEEKYLDFVPNFC